MSTTNILRSLTLYLRLRPEIYVPTSPAPTRDAEQDPSIFRLPSHSLDIGTTYEFRVNVTDSAGHSSIATQVGRLAICIAR